MLVSRSKKETISKSGKFKLIFDDGVSRIDFHQADLVNCSDVKICLVRNEVKTKIVPGVYSLSHILKDQDAYIEVEKEFSIGHISVSFSVFYDCSDCDSNSSILKIIENKKEDDSKEDDSKEDDSNEDNKAKKFSDNVLDKVSSETGVDKEEIIENAEDLDGNGYIKKEELEDSAKKITDKKQENDNNKIKKNTSKKKVTKKKVTKKKTTKKKATKKKK